VRNPITQGALIVALIACPAAAQILSLPSGGGKFTNATEIGPLQAAGLDFNLFTINSRNPDNTPLESQSGAISKFDLKAPGKARREYDKGYQLLMKKDAQSAIAHLKIATQIYPNYVAAHNALGTAYLNLNQNEQARDEFAQAVALDDHLPNSFLNLGCAHLALKDYAAAEETFRKASSIAPLDLQLQLALAYGEYVNRDYPAVLATARQVHERKHKTATAVHFFAAGAHQAQGHLGDAQHELETLLQEDPKSASAAQYRQILEDLKTEQSRLAEAKLHPAEPVKFSFSQPAEPTREQAIAQAQLVLQNIKEKNEIAEAEAAPDPVCTSCNANQPVTASGASAIAKAKNATPAGSVFRVAVDEVAFFFAATDHGKSVTNLDASEVKVRDDNKPPAALRSFRNESELPLRLGLVIDTSNSVTGRFSFEQQAAEKFLQKVVTSTSDQAFVIGVNNSVLLVQDFTSDLALAGHAIGQLAPGGGTALWDAVKFAAEKLGNRPEPQPVARVLVVISDGDDNSSSVTLKEAISSALTGQVAVYTVSTRELTDEGQAALLGDHALHALSDLTGGGTFVPGSIRRLTGSLADVQQVIRGRYMVSYQPAQFARDGRYRTIEINAQKDGHPLKIFARKGYYASAVGATSATP
jgi:Ca-activated chloride channel family protein